MRFTVIDEPLNVKCEVMGHLLDEGRTGKMDTIRLFYNTE